VNDFERVREGIRGCKCRQPDCYAYQWHAALDRIEAEVERLRKELHQAKAEWFEERRARLSTGRP